MEYVIFNQVEIAISRVYLIGHIIQILQNNYLKLSHKGYDIGIKFKVIPGLEPSYLNFFSHEIGHWWVPAIPINNKSTLV